MNPDTDTPEHINDLPLPSRLVDALREGRWQAPTGGIHQGIFPERAVFPYFYDVDTLLETNDTWQQESRPEFVGRASNERPPGDIDPRRSLLICELGPDQLVALDYRRSDQTPAVVYLAEPGWVEVAPSFDTLADQLGI